MTFGQHEKTHLPKGMIFKGSRSYQEHQINYFFTFHSNSFLSSHFLASTCSPETQDLLSILLLSLQLREPYRKVSPWFTGMQCIPLSRGLNECAHWNLSHASISLLSSSLPFCVLPSCFQITGLSSWNQRPKNFLSIMFK